VQRCAEATCHHFLYKLGLSNLIRHLPINLNFFIQSESGMIALRFVRRRLFPCSTFFKILGNKIDFKIFSIKIEFNLISSMLNNFSITQIKLFMMIWAQQDYIINCFPAFFVLSYNMSSFYIF